MPEIVIILIKIAIGIALIMTVVPHLIWMERKVSADFQLRIGPNRMGPAGIFQSAVDAVKLLFKERFAPRGADKLMYAIAPVAAFLPGVIAFCLIPWGGSFEAGGSIIQLSVANIDLGIIVILALSSLASYGIAYAGWASANQYALLGGVRSCAQLISYEIVLGLSVLSLIMITGSLNLSTIVNEQTKLLFGFFPAWNIFLQPFTFLLFLIAAFAETNRAPFDLPEAEQELVGGYHTEYGGLTWAWFMFGEYAALFTMCSLISTLFLGGWTLPGLVFGSEWYWLLIGFLILLVKSMALVFLFMWVRWTLPRFRWDQLMRLGWNKLIPLGFVNIFVTIGLIELRNYL